MQADLRLLCPNGGCAPVDDYSRCNFARVPSGALMAPGDLQGSDRGKSIQSALEKAAGNSTFFNASKPYLFSDSTVSLKVCVVFGY